MQFALAAQLLLTVVPHAPFMALLRHVSHGSPFELMRPGVVQYSLAHWVAHGPLPQTQLAMYWKNAALPPAQSVWQQLMQFC